MDIVYDVHINRYAILNGKMLLKGNENGVIKIKDEVEIMLGIISILLSRNI